MVHSTHEIILETFKGNSCTMHNIAFSTAEILLCQYHASRHTRALLSMKTSKCSAMLQISTLHFYSGRFHVHTLNSPSIFLRNHYIWKESWQALHWYNVTGCLKSVRRITIQAAKCFYPMNLTASSTVSTLYFCTIFLYEI